MNKIGFDNEKYLSMQTESIMQRVQKFGGKLYLEFGGKLFDDYHASRVLPGFKPDSKLQILLKLVIPSSLPTFTSCLKINVGMAWIGSIMGEYLVSKQGIGYLIVYGGQVFRLDLVMASTVILCILAAFMYGAVAILEKTLLKWKN